MKKFIKFAAIAALAFSFASCESFLDSTNYWSKTTADFPATPADAEQMITGIYNNLNIAIGNNPHVGHFLWSMAASDDCLGGGGANDQTMQAEDLLLNFGTDMYNNFYCDRYKGVARANLALETLENCGLDETTYNQYMGEAYFLRAYYMYELASMFGNIPYPVSSSVNAAEPQKSGVELWGQMLADLKKAVDMMPAKRNTLGDGHVDKYAAEALLGRIYLFASGFLGESTFGDVDKAYVAAAIKDCVDNSGYSLVSDPHNLWSYSNRCTVEDELSPWKGQGYKWVEDDNAVNPEAMFMIKFNTQPTWGTTIGYGNQTALFVGVRGQSNGTSEGNSFPFGTGWGMCPVSPQLVADWQAAEPNDKRLDASIISSDKLKGYTFGGDSNIQETGYYQCKIMPVMARKSDGSGFWTTFSNAMYEGSITWHADCGDDNFQLSTINDMVLIRFAEVLLMDAELNGNQASFDKVRARAGLNSKPANEENIRNERRWELAFEGVRFNDLRRYGEAYAVAALDKQNGTPCYNNGVKGDNHASKFNGGYGARYSATKGGFVKIPEGQVALSTGTANFVQNEGWEGSAVEFAGWD